jgi:hypothetical protein
MEKNALATAATFPLAISPALRAADPAFAGMCDVANGFNECIGNLRECLALQAQIIAAKDAEIATLRAQLSSRVS